jgi:hypothetical protein
MAVTVKRVTLWRKELDKQAGMLAQTLEPLAKAGTDLQLIMGYRYPGEEGKAAIEIYPVAGAKAAASAKGVGLAGSSIPTLLVEGDNRPGLAYTIAQALAGAEINLGFFVAQAIGRKYAAILGFETDADAKKAATLIKKSQSKRK